MRGSGDFFLKKGSYRLIVFIFLFVVPLAAKAQDMFNLSWHRSAKDSIAIQQVERLKFSLLDKAYKAPSLFNRGTYWFRLIITADTVAEDRILRITNPHLDTVCLYYKQDGDLLFVLYSFSGNQLFVNNEFLIM